MLKMVLGVSEQMVSQRRSTTFSKVAKTSFRKPRFRISFQICSIGFISGVYAPPEWSDRSKLWNAVEENEKTKDSRLAREFVVALPIEMGKTQWQNLLAEFIKENYK